MKLPFQLPPLPSSHPDMHHAIDWAVQAGGKDTTYGRGIANDGGGGALVTGYFYGEASFGSTVLTNGDTSVDAFVMHVTAAGVVDWAVQAGGTADSWGFGVAYDGAGGALVTGDFSGKASFGSTLLTSRGSSDVFVMHVTASGAIDWAFQAGGALFDSGNSIARVGGHDGVDGFLVSGSFSGEASFGSTSLISRGSDDAFVMHVTAAGAIDWVVQAGGMDSTYARCIANDGGGGALATGTFSGEASFGSTVLTSRGLPYAFVMHVTAAGAIDWAVQAGGTDYTYARSIANDGGGGALVTGYFFGEASFGSTVLTSGDTSADAFVMHVTAAGVVDWAVQAGGTADSFGSGVAYNRGSGGALVTGTFSGKASFGSTLLTSRGSSDVFVMHVTASGTIDWAIQGGGKLSDFGKSIAYVGAGAQDGVDGALVTGSFTSEASFGSSTLKRSGDVGACFAARLMPPPPSPPSRPLLPPRVPPVPPGLPPVSPLIPFLATAFLTSFLLLLCVCHRYRRLADHFRVSRERAQLDLCLLEHRVNVNAVELRTDPRGGGALRPESPPNSIPPGPPSSRGNKSSGAGSGAGSSSASSSHAAPEPQHIDPSHVPSPDLEVTVPASALQMTAQGEREPQASCEHEGWGKRFSGDQPYACDHDGCGKRFSDPSHLTAHIRSHTGERPFACDYEGCGKRFTQSSHLTTHIRTHTDDRPFACDHEGCGKRFSRSSHLTTHKRTHTGDQPYTCDHEGCGERFSRSDNLTRHKRTHTGERPYACDHEGCSERFSRSGHLTAHKRTHTGERPFACNHEGCGKRFSRSGSLKSHMRTSSHGQCSHNAPEHLCDDLECVQRRDMRRQLAVDFGLQAASSPAARPAPAVLPSTPQRSSGSSRKRPQEAEDWYEDEEGMQLAVALSASVTEAGLPDERRQQRDGRSARMQGASSSFDMEHAGNNDELDEVEVEVELEEEGPCFGCCLGGEVTLIGTARDRPDPSEPDGGWGYTPCCGQTAHFDCLGRWLTPDDPDHGRLVESTSGLVAIELKCPFCKKALSRSRTRMLRA